MICDINIQRRERKKTQKTKDYITKQNVKHIKLYVSLILIQYNYMNNFICTINLLFSSKKVK